jgi:hypothetical protein
MAITEAQVWNAIFTFVICLSVFYIRNFNDNRKKAKAAAVAAAVPAVPESAAVTKSAVAAVADGLDPFTGSEGDLKELLLDPCFADMSGEEKEALLSKWTKLDREQMELPSPQELKANKAAYQKQLLTVLAQRENDGLDDEAGAALDRKAAELREGLRLLDELQDEMMMDIVLKKVALAATKSKGGAHSHGHSHGHSPGKKSKKNR